MPAIPPTNIETYSLYNHLDVHGHIYGFKGNSQQWNSTYETLFGAPYSQLGSELVYGVFIDDETNTQPNPVAGGSRFALDSSINALGDRVAVSSQNIWNSAAIVQVFEWNGLVWKKMGSDIAGDVGDGTGYSISLNAAGDRLAVGALYAGSDRGRTRVYGWNGSTWSQLGIDILGEEGNTSAGWSVVLNDDGDRLAVGAYDNSGGGLGVGTGHVRVYSYNGTVWTQLGDDIDGVEISAYTGYDVSFNGDGNILAVSSPLEDGERGVVRVYSWQDSQWSQLGQDVEGVSEQDIFGISLGLNSIGDVLVVGSSAGGSTTSGYAAVYRLIENVWTQVGDRITSTETVGSFGWSVSINSLGDKIVVGEPNANSNKGKIKVYQWDESEWIKVEEILGETNDVTTDAEFGYSVSSNAAGDTIICNSSTSSKVITNSHKLLTYKWSSNITGKTIYVDSISGSNSRINTVPYNEHRPYKNIASAVAASTVGDLIYVRAGDYTISSTINLDGKGNIYFELGTNVTVNTTNTTSREAFILTAVETKNIFGHANFTLTGTNPSLVKTQVSGAVFLYCNNITGTATTSAIFDVSQTSRLFIQCENIFFSNATSILISQTGTSNIRVIADRVVCGKYLVASPLNNSTTYTYIRDLTTSNATSGIDIISASTRVANTTYTSEFYIDRYTHTGKGISCAWQENLVDKISFVDTRWISKTNNNSHISATSTVVASNKQIKLLGTNTMTGITNSNNSISSDTPLTILTQNTYAATAANANITFKVGLFTIDPDTNSFN